MRDNSGAYVNIQYFKKIKEYMEKNRSALNEKQLNNLILAQKMILEQQLYNLQKLADDIKNHMFVKDQWGNERKVKDGSIAQANEHHKIMKKDQRQLIINRIKFIVATISIILGTIAIIAGIGMAVGIFPVPAVITTAIAGGQAVIAAAPAAVSSAVTLIAPIIGAEAIAAIYTTAGAAAATATTATTYTSSIAAVAVAALGAEAALATVTSALSGIGTAIAAGGVTSTLGLIARSIGQSLNRSARASESRSMMQEESRTNFAKVNTREDKGFDLPSSLRGEERKALQEYVQSTQIGEHKKPSPVQNLLETLYTMIKHYQTTTLVRGQQAQKGK